MGVGIRELKAHLSEYVAQVSNGGEVIVTDRGRPVARLVPYSAISEVDRGIEEGWIEPARRVGLAPIERVSSDLSTLDVLEDDRG